MHIRFIVFTASLLHSFPFIPLYSRPYLDGYKANSLSSSVLTLATAGLKENTEAQRNSYETTALLFVWPPVTIKSSVCRED